MIVEATFDFVEATFDFVATNGNNVERLYCKMSSFRQSRNKLNTFNLFRLCQKDEISFDIVAKNGNNVEATFDIVQFVAFDNVAGTLLLVWTRLNGERRKECSSNFLCSRGNEWSVDDVEGDRKPDSHRLSNSEKLNCSRDGLLSGLWCLVPPLFRFTFPQLSILEVCHYSRRLSIMCMLIYSHDIDGLSVLCSLHCRSLLFYLLLYVIC